MQKKIKIWLSYLMAMGFIFVFFTSCQKTDNNNPDNPANGKTNAVFNPNKMYGKVIDIDGNVYKTIAIGTQTWMAENLRTTHYQNGEAIPEEPDDTSWANLNTGAICTYQNTENIDTVATYGRLYNWYAAVDSRNIAPKGWHVPTYDELKTLMTCLGVDSVAIGKLKESDTTHWHSPNIGATNESGFTALPGGLRGIEGYDYLGNMGIWWSSTYGDNIIVVCLHLDYKEYGTSLTLVLKNLGCSVRCVKDN